MMRFSVKRWLGAGLFIVLAAGLSGCVYGGPGYYDAYYGTPGYYSYYGGPYYAGPPVYGSVWFGGGRGYWGHRHWR